MWLVVYLQADYERRLLQLCNEGCKADISQFRELLRKGVDVNIYDEVCTIYIARNFHHMKTFALLS